MQIAISLWDPDARLVLCNDAYRELAGQAAEILVPGVGYKELLGHIYDYNIGDKSDLSREQWVEWRHQNEKTANAGYVSQQLDGRYIDTRKHILADGSMVTINFDVTESKRREEELDVEREKAETANQAKSDFLANMSHELRTPLNAVIGYSEALLNELFGPIANEKQADYLESIKSSGGHLLSLINDVLDLSTVEAGKVEISDTSFNIKPLSESAFRFVDSIAASKDLKMSNNMDADLPDIVADELKLRQILVNILTNAVKFTPSGGQVSMSATMNQDGSISVSVEDTGVGMSREDIALALEKFGQVVSLTHQDQKGTGLGLPLTKGLIEAHGGKLEIDSVLDEGTIVRIVIPTERVLSASQNPIH